MFTLHPQLERDTLPVADLALSRVLLMNNRLFPWLILVPKVEGVREIFGLDAWNRHMLINEIALASGIMYAAFNPAKLNVAELGNQVPQLHVHIIARFSDDAAWPQPVWGKGAEPYGDPAPLVEKLKAAFASARGE